MPHCEGLPDGPCPQNANSRSVKLSQGDLMLCSKCDAIRFPSPSTNSNPVLSGKNGVNVTAKGNVTAKPKKLDCTATNANSGSADSSPAQSNSNQSQPGLESESTVHISAIDQAPSSKVTTGSTQSNSKQKIGNKESGGDQTSENGSRKTKEIQQKNTSSTQPLPTVSNNVMPMSQLEIVNVINPVDNVQSAVSDNSNSPTSSMHDIKHGCDCIKLKAEINSLNTVIVQLNTKVEFLLSYLGLQKDISNDQTQNQSVEDPQSNTSTALITAPHNSTINYSNAVCAKPAAQLSSPMRQAVISAVYVDLHSKSARSNNIIVTGLPKGEKTDDKDTFTEMIEHEFNIRPTVKHCRRLGKATANKPQNLLVSLESPDHVKRILSNAKQLRNSVNDCVRDSVFINPDLTKAEAAVAYEERCRRRLQREERSSKQQQQHHPQASLGKSGQLNPKASNFELIPSVDQLPTSVNQETKPNRAGRPAK